MIASIIIGLRAGDNSTISDPRFDVDFKPRRGRDPLTGLFPLKQWSPDPVSKQVIALGANWGKVSLFFPDTDKNGNDLGSMLAEPPDIKTPQFIAALKHVAAEGADPVHSNPMLPGMGPPAALAVKEKQFHYYMGKYWSYDGTPSLCAPVRLYNQIAYAVLIKYKAQIAPHMDDAVSSDGAVDQARYYAILNLAMVNAGVEAWKGKYKYQYWRPVTGVRSFLPAGNIPSLQDSPEKFFPTWYPLGAQNTNASVGYNFTPPFPAYPSGHAVFGSAFFEVLRKIVPNDKGFTATSDELHEGSFSVDAYNFQRCDDKDKNSFFCKGVTFKSFADAEVCNSESRIWLGVHWDFDAKDGERLGRAIGRSAWRQLQAINGASNVQAAEVPRGSCPLGNFQADKTTLVTP